MPQIKLITNIKAEPQLVFDLSRSIDFHKLSTARTNEEVIAGRTTGLITLGESVTWKAKHFGIYQKLTSKITEYREHSLFVDEMTKGIFKYFRHEHHFHKTEQGTKMIDVFDYKSPFGLLGQLADILFLKTYMTKLLTTRNNLIKLYTEPSELQKSISL